MVQSRAAFFEKTGERRVPARRHQFETRLTAQGEQNRLGLLRLDVLARPWSDTQEGPPPKNCLVDVGDANSYVIDFLDFQSTRHSAHSILARHGARHGSWLPSPREIQRGNPGPDRVRGTLGFPPLSDIVPPPRPCPDGSTHRCPCPFRRASFGWPCPAPHWPRPARDARRCRRHS